MAFRVFLQCWSSLHLIVLVSLLNHADSLTCVWESNSGKLIPLIGEGVTETDVTDLEGCKNLCIEKSEYLCHAVNYNSNEKKCELHVENKQTAYVDSSQTGWKSRIRPRCAGIWLPWTSVNNTAVSEISGITFGTTAYNNPDRVRDCVSQCMKERDALKQCRSVTLYRIDNACELQTIRSGDENYDSESTTDFQTFNRPSWYLDNSPYSTSATLQSLSTVGTAVFIFHNSHQLPVSGYLVGWRYYHLGSDRCNSYASIWRGSVQSGFKLISKTLLNDTDINTGPKFQYVTEVIRVRQGDVVGIHVDYKLNERGGLPDGCRGNRVSVSSNGTGSQVVVVTAGNLTDKALPVGITLVVNNSNLQSRTAAINAFIAPYLFVPQAPVIDHIVNSNQLMMTWIKPNTTKDLQYYPIRYRLHHCSTDLNFTDGHEVTCLNSTLHKDVTDLTITTANLISYKPVYMRIQIIRNVYGREEPDDAYSPTSNLFCTAHQRTGLSLKLTRTSQLTPDSTVSISIQLQGVPDNDTCLVEFQVRDNSDSVTEFINVKSHGVLTFSQGMEITFSGMMVIKLADQHTMNNSVTGKTYTVPSAPDAPERFNASSRNQNSTGLSWSLFSGDDFSGTQITCKVANKQYNTNAGTVGRTISNSTAGINEVNLIVSGLHPQVQYNCSAKYLIDNGYGRSSSVQFWTKPNSPSLKPDYESITDAIIRTTTDGQVNITIPAPTKYPNQPGAVARFMQIRVERLESRKRRLTNPNIKAELDKTNYTNPFFVVGDNTTYGGFENAQLNEGAYRISVGFRAETESEVFEFQVIPGGDNITVEGPPTTLAPTPTNPAVSTLPPVELGIEVIAGIAVGAAVLIVIIIVIIVIVVKKRRKSTVVKKLEQKPDISAQYLSISPDNNENRAYESLTETDRSSVQFQTRRSGSEQRNNEDARDAYEEIPDRKYENITLS